MKNILIQLASHALALAILSLLSPYILYINISEYLKDAYQEEHANVCMHRDIDNFLKQCRCI